MVKATLCLHLYLSTRLAIHAFRPSLPLFHAKYATARLTRRHVLSSDQVAAFHQDYSATRTLEKNASQGSFPFPDPFPPPPPPRQHALSIQKRVEPAQEEKTDDKRSTIRLLHGLQDALYSPAEAMVEKRLTRFVEEAVEHATERQAYGLAWRRVGATIMAVLPLFGAAFALHLAQHDVRRAQHELEPKNRQPHQLPGLKGLHTLSSLPPATWLAAGLFLAAGVADVVDALLHVVMSHHIFSLHNSVVVDPTSWWQQHHASLVDPNLMKMVHSVTPTVDSNPSSVWQSINPTAPHHHQHHQLMDASALQHAWTAAQDASTSANTNAGNQEASLATLEEWSSACVLTSAMCVALGEVLSFCNTNDQHREDTQQQDKTDTASSMMAPPRGLPQAA